MLNEDKYWRQTPRPNDCSRASKMAPYVFTGRVHVFTGREHVNTARKHGYSVPSLSVCFYVQTANSTENEIAN